MTVTRLSAGCFTLLYAATLLGLAHHHDASGNRPPPGSAWEELNRSMHHMHVETSSLHSSGKDDVDFVKLMLPHHQAAINMAKTQLIFGKDPAMRRLAQEILTDQQSEIELMARWLKREER